MASSEISHIDLESGGHRRSSAGGSDEDGSLCFSDADEGSCISQFFSTYDGSYDDHSFVCGSDYEGNGISDSRRFSSAAESDCSIVVVEDGIGEMKVHLGKVERDCRICHLTLESTNPESGIAIELGCSCKDDLGAAHKHCAEAWFKIKGNRTCEICNSVAHNVFGANESEQMTQQQQANETRALPTNTPVSAPVPSSSSADQDRSCLNGHRLVNFLLACMVFAFVISWFFHFNIS